MQIGDVTEDGDSVHGTSYREDSERYPMNHLDYGKIDFVNCVVYWSPRTVLSKGLELTIQEEIARKE